MDMTIIDTVRADTLNTADVVKIDGVLLMVLTVEDTNEGIVITDEEYDEHTFEPDLLVDIYGYTTEED